MRPASFLTTSGLRNAGRSIIGVAKWSCMR
jgi:hypothetical protein